MKNLILTASLLVLVGCGSNSYKCRQEVEKAFPFGTVYDRRAYSYIVDSCGTVYYVYCGNITNTNISNKQLIFKYK